jgi:hypothetical protein
LTLEFIALANHRKSIRAEIANYMKKFRAMQLDTMSTVLEAYGLDPETWPPGSIVLTMWGISQYLLIEQAFDLDTAHADTIALIEKHITALEGPRQSSPKQFAASQRHPSSAHPAVPSVAGAPSLGTAVAPRPK